MHLSVSVAYNFFSLLAILLLFAWGWGGVAGGGSLVVQLVKNLPAKIGTWVQSLGWEDLLEKGKATHSSILAWRVPWMV